jgi:hypothetical protein
MVSPWTLVVKGHDCCRGAMADAWQSWRETLGNPKPQLPLLVTTRCCGLLEGSFQVVAVGKQ